MVLAGLFQCGFDISAANRTPTGNERRKLVAGWNDAFVIFEGGIQRSGNTGRGGDVARIDAGQCGTGRQQEQQRRCDE